MKQTQNFTIRPNGAVKGGSASYAFDTDSGEIDYEVEATVGIWPFSKTKTFSGKYTSTHSQALSENFSKQGDVSQIGPLSLQVELVIPGGADLNLKIAGRPENGTAVIDTSSKFIRVKQLVALVSVPVLGTLTLEADAVALSRARPPYFPSYQPRSLFGILVERFWELLD